VSVLRWCANPRDRVAGFRVLQLLPGIGPSTAAKIFDQIAAQRNVVDVLKRFAVPNATAEDWPAFVKLIARLRKTENRAPIGIIRTIPETRVLLEQCMEEVAAVARARGIQLDDTVVTDTMSYVDSLAANATTSLQRDIAEGKPSEIDCWNGAAVWQGGMAKVATPVNQFTYHSRCHKNCGREERCCFPNEPRPMLMLVAIRRIVSEASK
jgi:Ketopantoate reductase PanE/ApbA C terminal